MKNILLFLTLFFLFTFLLHRETIVGAFAVAIGNIMNDPAYYRFVTETSMRSGAEYNALMVSSGEKVSHLRRLAGSGTSYRDARIHESLADEYIRPLLGSLSEKSDEKKMQVLREAVKHYRYAYELLPDERLSSKYHFFLSLLESETVTETRDSYKTTEVSSGNIYSSGEGQQEYIEMNTPLTEEERKSIRSNLDDLTILDRLRENYTDVYGSNSQEAMRVEIQSLYNTLTNNTGSEERDW